MSNTLKKLGEAELELMWDRRFLEKLYSNSIQNTIATLYSDKAIKADLDSPQADCC